MARTAAKLGIEFGEVTDRMQEVTRWPDDWRENPECIEALDAHQKANGLKGFIVGDEAISTWFVRGQYAVRQARGAISREVESEPPQYSPQGANASALDEWQRIKSTRSTLVAKLEAEIEFHQSEIQKRRAAIKEIKEG